MKKIIVTSALFAICSASLNANTTTSTEDMYIKVGGLTNIGGKTSENPFTAAEAATQTDDYGHVNDIYGERKFGAFGGIGFNIAENVSAEILVEYSNGPEYIKSTDFAAATDQDDAHTITTKLSSSGFSGFANASVSSMEFGQAKILIGGGVGLSMMETVLERSLNITGGDSSLSTAKALADTTKTYANDFAFAWNVGASLAYDFSSEAALELGYRFTNYGKPGSNEDDLAWSGHSRNAHNVHLGLRFNL